MKTIRQRELFPIVRDYMALCLKRDRAFQRGRLHHSEMYEQLASDLHRHMTYKARHQVLAAVLSRRTGRFL